jgi:pimeloyl-ACP methyl ester carboxylesterase
VNRRTFVTQTGTFLAVAGAAPVLHAQPTAGNALVPHTSIHRVEADGVTVFYREAGPADAPVVLLLHDFPTSSFQYRELIPRLADRYRVIAPDLPGFGFTDVPDQALQVDLRRAGAHRAGLYRRARSQALRALRV